MLEKKEKQVLLFLCEVCTSKKAYLISASQIAESVSQKFVLSIAELDSILLSLSKDNYLEFVISDGKNGNYYCVMLKSKGLTFKRDLKKKKLEVIMLLLRTVGITVVSFVLGIILRAIFS